MPRKDYIPTYINGKELAQLSGNSPAFITQSRQKGLFAAKGLCRRKKGSGLFTYHRERCIEILQHLDVSKKRKGGTDTSRYKYNAERSLLVKRQRQKIEFEMKCQRKEFLPRKDVERLLFVIGRQLRESLLNQPARTAARVAAKSEKSEKQIYQILYRESERTLKDCAEKDCAEKLKKVIL
jgi:hypothetical protein